jgi:hypothetical protein
VTTKKVVSVFDQADYNTVVESLDKALAVFKRCSEDPEEAFRKFVEMHYFAVWRMMNP